MKKILLAFIFSLLIIQLNGQCVGIQIIGFNGDNPDQILLNITADLPGNTTFYITDNEWDGTSFNSGENTTTWTTPADGVGAGSTVFIGDGSAPSCGTSSADAVPAFSTSGDNVYITSVTPSGTVSAVDICFGVDFGGAGTSIVGISGVDLGSVDNALASGDPTDAANWTTSGSVISLGSGSCLVPLPVELTSFIATASQKDVSLNWTTSSELNNSHFDIEHSIDGANFRAIDEVTGNGTTQLKQEYSYTHTTPAMGTNYYRLKQVDFDGAFEYSEIRVVEVKRNGKVVINPSAAIAEITVELAETTGDNNQIGIYDMMGRTVLMSNFDGSLNTKTLDISNLQKGYYVVRVQAGSEIFTERFMKMVD